MTKMRVRARGRDALNQVRQAERLGFDEVGLAALRLRDVGGQQIVLPVDLHAMPGEMHQRHVTRLERGLEVRDGAVERAAVGVPDQLHTEARFRQRTADRLGIAHGLPQRLDLAVGVDADQQRMAGFRARIRANRQAADKAGTQDEQTHLPCVHGHFPQPP